MPRTTLRGAALGALLVALAAGQADAQRRYRVHIERDIDRGRVLALQLGALSYDRSGDDLFPMAALRAGWHLSDAVIAEVGVSYALVEVDVVRQGVTEEENGSLATATVGIQAEADLGRFHPYIGLAAGLFARLDPEGGDRFVRATHAVPVGLRVRLTDALALRAEVRPRFDEHQDGGAAVDIEQTLGLSFRL